MLEGMADVGDEMIVTVGVDTHSDVHVAAALDQAGRLLGIASFPATTRDSMPSWRPGSSPSVSWARSAWRAPAATTLGCCASCPTRVVEVDRRDRSARRRNGKSDPLDAESAARAVLFGRASGTPKTRDAQLEMIR